jgi:hypothetical protein
MDGGLVGQPHDVREDAAMRSVETQREAGAAGHDQHR